MKVLSITPTTQIDKLPVLPLAGNYIPAGFPSPAGEYIEEAIDMNEVLIKHPSSTFLVKVEGNSMIDAFIPPKALLVVDKSLRGIKHNDTVVAVLNGEFTVKKLVINKKGSWLMPANEQYKPIQIKEDTNFEVWGVVTKIIIDPKDVI